MISFYISVSNHHLRWDVLIENKIEMFLWRFFVLLSLIWYLFLWCPAFYIQLHQNLNITLKFIHVCKEFNSITFPRILLRLLLKRILVTYYFNSKLNKHVWTLAMHKKPMLKNETWLRQSLWQCCRKNGRYTWTTIVQVNFLSEKDMRCMDHKLHFLYIKRRSA